MTGTTETVYVRGTIFLESYNGPAPAPWINTDPDMKRLPWDDRQLPTQLNDEPVVLPSSLLKTRGYLKLNRVTEGELLRQIFAGIPVGTPEVIFKLEDGEPKLPNAMTHTKFRDRTNTYQFAESRHYAPGTKPKGKVIEARRFEKYEPNEKYATGGTVSWHYESNPTWF